MSYQPRRMNGEDPYKKMRKNYEEEGKNYKSKKKNSKNNKIDIVFKILAIVFIVITVIFYMSILSLDLLPSNFVTIFTIVEVVFTMLLVLGLAKKHKTYKLNIICLIIVLLLSGIYIYVANYANATNKFLDSMFQEVQETEEYYVVVRKDSNYDEIEEIDGKTIYAFKIEDDVKENIDKKVDVDYKTSDSLTGLGEDLLNEDIDVILISSSQHSMLGDEIKNYEENTKIIFTANHNVKKTAEVSTENSKYTVNNGKFNVYISGIDTSGSISNVSRSDANIIASVNTNTHEVLLTSIPRDYYVTLHSKGAKDKLTHSGIYGINETIATVEDFLNIDINYYVRVNFTTVIKLVDILGGVKVYSDYDFTSLHGNYHFDKGYNYVDGEKALAFSRERYAFSAGDNQRVKNQQAVIEAIINKILNSTTILTKYTDILESLEGSFQTNIEQKDISNLVKDQLNNMSSWKIKNNALVGTGSYGPTYSMGSTKLYIMLPDSESVSAASEKIDDILGN